ncbi:MAG: ATP-binding protein [Opitutales bacterium]
MKLSRLIRERRFEIAEEWFHFARNHIESAKPLDETSVRDHVIEMLIAVADDMDVPQSGAEQERKGKGQKASSEGEDEAAHQHGAERVQNGFSITEASSEFRALRASIIRTWERHLDRPLDATDLQEMIRFNESIDEAWMTSVARYHSTVDSMRDWSLGVLGHDLRSPLSAASATIDLLATSTNLSEDESEAVRCSRISLNRMTELIHNLLELTRVRLGAGMRLNRQAVDLPPLCQGVVHEIRTAQPDVDIQLELPSALEGEFDPGRIEQVVTNLVHNAIRHGLPNRAITLHLTSADNEATLRVHNEGPAISKAVQERIFRGLSAHPTSHLQASNSVGLGLLIVAEIVKAHGGTIMVESSEAAGTTVTLTLPRYQGGDA